MTTTPAQALKNIMDNLDAGSFTITIKDFTSPGKSNDVTKENADSIRRILDAAQAAEPAAPELLNALKAARIALTQYREILAKYAEGREYPYGCEAEAAARQIIERINPQ